MRRAGLSRVPGASPDPPGFPLGELDTPGELAGDSAAAADTGDDHPLAEGRLDPTELRSVAEQALGELRGRMREGRQLSPERDGEWFGVLVKTLGVRSSQLGPDGQPQIVMTDPRNIGREVRLSASLTIEFINAKPSRLQALADTLNAMLAATDYRPRVVNDLGYRRSLHVHNAEVAARLSRRYTREQFAGLFQLAMTNGVFEIQIDPSTGIPETTEITGDEDPIMKHFWVSDLCQLGAIQDDARYADSRPRALQSLATFYQSEAGAFWSAVNRPEPYRRLDSTTGVHHIFTPALTRFGWLLPKRLESHGLALSELVGAVISGVVRSDSWGLAEPSSEVLQSIAWLVRYFAAIEYWHAPSNGVWEELAAPTGLTSDISFVRQALEAVIDLMTNPAYEDKLGRVREDLSSQLGPPGPNGEPRQPWGALLGDEEALRALARQGEAVVRSRLTRRPPVESEDRLADGEVMADAALAFACSASLTLEQDPIDDVEAYVEVLAFLEQRLMRPNGMIKYEPIDLVGSDGSNNRVGDSYLAPDWGLMTNGRGQLSFHKETFEDELEMPITMLEPSNADRFITRARYAVPGKEAEWTFVTSELAHAYNVQLGKLLAVLAGLARDPDPREQALLESLVDKTTELMNRSYAQITGGLLDARTMVKANGRTGPSWRVPEAYQHVTTLRIGEDGERETAMMPGVNTPLGWSTAALWRVSQLFAHNLEQLEAYLARQR